MKKFHIALSVKDLKTSIEDYSRYLGQAPVRVIEGEYALWRTDTLNFSIRREVQSAGNLRHLGWEDSNAQEFSKTQDVNGIVWENFSASLQEKEIQALWPKK